jgi:hypothetical protein
MSALSSLVFQVAVKGFAGTDTFSLALPATRHPSEAAMLLIPAQKMSCPLSA